MSEYPKVISTLGRLPVMVHSEAEEARYLKNPNDLPEPPAAKGQGHVHHDPPVVQTLKTGPAAAKAKPPVSAKKSSKK